MHHPTDRITHTTAFVTPVVEHWLEREIAQWVDIRNNMCKPYNGEWGWGKKCFAMKACKWLLFIVMHVAVV